MFLSTQLLLLLIVVVSGWTWFFATGAMHPAPVRPSFRRLLLDLPPVIVSAHVERRANFQAALVSVYWKA